MNRFTPEDLTYSDLVSDTDIALDFLPLEEFLITFYPRFLSSASFLVADFNIGFSSLT